MSERHKEQGAEDLLPRLAFIADGFTDEAVAARVADAVGAGVQWVHLRDHGATPEGFWTAAERLAENLRAATPGVRLSVNARLEVARALGAGFHTGARGPALREARAALGPGAQLGYSAHTAEETRAAVEAGANYVFFSPVFPTRSKPDHSGVGLEALRVCCARSPVPVFALGGVTPERVAACCDAGAYGVAVLSGILHARDPKAASAAYLKALSQYSATSTAQRSL